jgi:hypothetical protein
MVRVAQRDGAWEVEVLPLGAGGCDGAVSPAHGMESGVVADNVGFAIRLELAQRSDIRHHRHHEQGVWAPDAHRELNEVGLHCPQPRK